MRKIIAVLTFLALMSCAASTTTQTSGNYARSDEPYQDDYTEIPFNFEIKAKNLPTIEKEGEISVELRALVLVEGARLSLETTDGVKVTGKPFWEGDILPGAKTEIVFPLAAVAEGQTTLVLTLNGSVRNVVMSRKAEITIGVGKRGTMLEDTKYQSGTGE
jgi:hypothetical protein